MKPREWAVFKKVTAGNIRGLGGKKAVLMVFFSKQYSGKILDCLKCFSHMKKFRVNTFLTWQVRREVGLESEESDLFMFLSELADISKDSVITCSSCILSHMELSTTEMQHPLNN